MKKMSNPYEVLGVSENDSDETIKKAYRDLVKKYHPDQYTDNPLSSLASEKIKEINVAYDEIMRIRQNGTSGKSYSANDSSAYDEIWNCIQRKDIAKAEELLINIPADKRGAHWYFLMGEVARLKGWYDEARANYTKAINMEPNNMVYRRALNNMYYNTQNYRKESSQRGYNTGENCCDFCTYLYCADCCCECFGGDIISCC